MRSLTIILILAMAFWGFKSKNKTNKELSSQSNPIEKIEIKEELDWSELERFINLFANTKPDLESGKDTIINFAQNKFPSFDSEFLTEIDFSMIQKEFLEWIIIPLTKSPPKNEINALYFGLFSSTDPQLSDDGEEKTIIYIAGSETSPEQDKTDWAVDPEYLPPERYCVLTSYIRIDQQLSKYNNTSDLEQVLFNGITNLILVNSLVDLKQNIDKSGTYVGSGFDSGPCYLIGKIE